MRQHPTHTGIKSVQIEVRKKKNLGPDADSSETAFGYPDQKKEWREERDPQRKWLQVITCLTAIPALSQVKKREKDSVQLKVGQRMCMCVFLIPA